MEEKDIKIIEDMINNCEEHIRIYDEAFVILEEIKSVKKLLQAYKQDEEIIKEMAKYIEDKMEDDICNKSNCFADKYVDGYCEKCVNCIIDYFRKKCE